VRGVAVSAITVAAAAAIVAVLIAPSARTTVPASWRPRHTVVAGAFHVHTNLSPDSAGSIDEAAAAARRAGLSFVVATEHGDDTRPPLRPAYRSGVLWIDAVEISTADGHYATFGIAQSPYPLAGEGRDVVDDVRRLGGVGIVAHGESPKSEGQWRDWNAKVDGFEWLNLDSAWRDAGAGKLLRAALTYWRRPGETLASLVSRPDRILDRIDAAAAERHIIMLAATDAHGRTVPSDEACFSAFSTHVELDRPLSGNADQDAAAIIAGLRAGHHYTAIDALASPAEFEFVAHSGAATASEGDTLADGQPVTFEMHVAAPPGATMSLVRNGQPMHRSQAALWRFEADGSRAEYRVEVTLPKTPGPHPIPWIVSNPIYIGRLPAGPPPASVDSGRTNASSLALAWHGESDPSSKVGAETRSSDGSNLALRYTLGAGAAGNQFAAASSAAPPNLSEFRGITLTARADHPLRFTVQLRAKGDRRWRRSIYADTTARTSAIAFDDMRPVAPNAEPHPQLDSLEAVLLLVEGTNTAPGTSAVIDVTDLAFLR
jgi:hypothetical protein